MGYKPFGISLTIEEMVLRLDLLNVWLSERNKSAELLLIGGAALLIHSLYEDVIFRTTKDIDVQYKITDR